MTRDEWTNGGRNLLLAGWPKSRDVDLDDDGIVYLLAEYSAEDVERAIKALVGVNEYMPKAGMIARQVKAMRPVPAHPVAPPVDASVQAKRDWMVELDRLETARRDAELDLWWDAHPECDSWGAGILRKLGIEPVVALAERDFAA